MNIFGDDFENMDDNDESLAGTLHDIAGVRRHRGKAGIPNMSTDKTIIGLIGKAGHGKDEFCKAVIQHYGSTYAIERIALADALKREVDELGPLKLCTEYGIPYDPDAPKNDLMCSTGHGKQRQLLQFWGGFRREKDPLYWINKLDAAIGDSSAAFILIPDVRYRNEAEYVSAHGGFTVRIVRHDYQGLTGEAAAHVSENELNDYRTNYQIDVGANDLPGLHFKACEVFEDIAGVFACVADTEAELSSQGILDNCPVAEIQPSDGRITTQRGESSSS